MIVSVEDEYLAHLAALVNERARLEYRITELVVTLRQMKVPVHWKKIGEALEVSTQAAQQRYAPNL